MAFNSGAFIGGVVLLALALFDGTGQEFHFRKRYRGLAAIKERRKKRMLAHIISSVGCWVVFFSPEGQSGLFFLGAAILLIGLIFSYLIDRDFKKKSK